MGRKKKTAQERHAAEERERRKALLPAAQAVWSAAPNVHLIYQRGSVSVYWDSGGPALHYVREISPGRSFRVTARCAEEVAEKFPEVVVEGMRGISEAGALETGSRCHWWRGHPDGDFSE